MAIEDYKKISVVLPNQVLAMLEDISKKELHTVSQQIVIIIMNYFRDYKRMLELVNEDDFGVITEEKLRNFLEKEENQINYNYEDIEHFSFEELFKFWIENFSKKK